MIRRLGGIRVFTGEHTYTPCQSSFVLFLLTCHCLVGMRMPLTERKKQLR